MKTLRHLFGDIPTVGVWRPLGGIRAIHCHRTVVILLILTTADTKQGPAQTIILNQSQNIYRKKVKNLCNVLLNIYHRYPFVSISHKKHPIILGTYSEFKLE